MRKDPVRFLTHAYVNEIADVSFSNKRNAKTLRDRFFDNVKPTAHGCWLWTGRANANGYGLIYVHPYGNFYVHRLSYLLHVGDIPYGKYVLHACDDPSCVYPGHLRVGTQSENIRESVARGRHVLAGIHDPNPKIDENAVRLIRRLYDSGASSIAQLSDHYQVGYMCIYRIVARRTWKHVLDSQEDAA